MRLENTRPHPTGPSPPPAPLGQATEDGEHIRKVPTHLPSHSFRGQAAMCAGCSPPAREGPPGCPGSPACVVSFPSSLTCPVAGTSLKTPPLNIQRTSQWLPEGRGCSGARWVRGRRGANFRLWECRDRVVIMVRATPVTISSRTRVSDRSSVPAKVTSVSTLLHLNFSVPRKDQN